jgi:hypothetical protein
MKIAYIVILLLSLSVLLPIQIVSAEEEREPYIDTPSKQMDSFYCGSVGQQDGYKPGMMYVLWCVEDPISVIPSPNGGPA